MRVATASGVASDWKWADRFLPEIRTIVGPHLLRMAPLPVDRNEAADLVTLEARSLMIACRVRRVSNAEYFNQFTLRSRRYSGAKTELEKIVEGYGDLLFYGFADREGFALKSWMLIDLRAFRSALITSAQKLRTGEILNADGTAFRWYDVRYFPQKPPLIIARSEDPDRPKPEMRQSA